MKRSPALPVGRDRGRGQTAGALLFGGLVALACSGNPDRQTLAGLRAVEPDLAEVAVSDGIDRAMAGYRAFLEEAPTSALTPEAMRRLADLQLEKEYGVGGEPAPGTRAPAASPGRPSTFATTDATLAPPSPAAPVPVRAEQRAPHTATPGPAESLHEFEARATGTSALAYAPGAAGIDLPGGTSGSAAGPLEALALYDRILATYPDYPHADQVLYQKARAFDELGRVDEAIEVSALLVEKYPRSQHLDEIQFRRGEYYFTRKKFIEAEKAYAAIVPLGARSDFFELALYKLGWTFYKQMLMPEALDSYVQLLDHKVESGWDFEQQQDEADAQRIADSYRVMSLCFSDLGGAEAIRSYFATAGAREYEHRVYRHLAEFYFEKLRYQDAADTYEAFVGLYPVHASSPHFGMRVIEIYRAGDFPKLVLEAKKSFASRYALDAEYWRHFDPAASPEVIAYLKQNLEDLANHYHALYQNAETPEERVSAFAEGTQWYRRFLASFPDAPETPAIHHRLADLLLENESFPEAAREYEHIAYVYPPHERSAAAGYAAIFAHREAEKRAEAAARETIRREAVASTIRFVDRFPEHEQAAKVLGVAVQDLFELREFPQAVELGRRLTASYRTAEVGIRRSAWLVVAHSSFELGDFAPAESAYAEVLALIPEDDASRGEIVNNLAASIYKQGERANEAGDHRAAADHFLRIARVAPRSEIRPIAEYDAGAALLRLEDWDAALEVLEAFRSNHPDHDLHQEATQQVAFVYRKTGNASRAAEEYERVAREAETPELRAESLLVAGQLYEDAGLVDRALGSYRAYVSEFTDPIETAVVTRFKMSQLFEQTGDAEGRRAELRQIVALDRQAGDGRTGTIRGLAARSALFLAEDLYREFQAVSLRLPFERSLQEKQRRMNDALNALALLVDYQVGEITAAATFYMAEVYGDFSQSLIESERPTDLSPADLADYEGVLEEEAYPFEEKSIAVHRKNLELMANGVYNEWIDRSLGRLAELMPGRYAKPEESTGPLASIEAYTYRTPASAVPTATGATDVTASTASPADAQDGAPTADATPIAEPMHEPEAAPAPTAASAESEAEPAEQAPIEATHLDLPAAPDPAALDESAEPAPLELPAEESIDAIP
ncbi:MAG: tetratricopeptide repeat protein [Myxococcota bacterium]